MKVLIVLSCLFLSAFSLSLAHAGSYRVYCTADGVNLEHRPDQNYDDNNLAFNNVSNFIVNENQLPLHQYAEQLKCNGKTLTADLGIKPPQVVKEERVKAIQADLDAALTDPNPNIVKILTLQRNIEKLKEER